MWSLLGYKSSVNDSKTVEESTELVNATDNAVSETQIDVVAFSDLDFRQVAASMVDSLLENTLYEQTMELLNAESDLTAQRISFENGDTQRGLLIDGKRRGWHAVWLGDEENDEEEGTSALGRYSGWFYVQHDDNGAVIEPFVRCEDEEPNWHTLKYFPSRNTLLFYAMGDNGDDALSTVVVLNTGPSIDDHVIFCLDTSGAVWRMAERYRGDDRIEVRYQDGLVHRVLHLNDDASPALDVQIGAKAPDISDIVATLH